MTHMTSTAGGFARDVPVPTVSLGPAPSTAQGQQCVLVHSDLPVVRDALWHAGYSWDAAAHVWWHAVEGVATFDQLQMVAERHAFPLGGFDAAAHAVRGPAFTKPQHFVDVAVVPQSNGAAPIIKVTHAFYVHECLHNKLHYTFNGIDRSWNTVFTGPATLNELKNELAAHNYVVKDFDNVMSAALAA